MNDGLFSALGDGWLGKVIVAIVAGIIAWLARGPADRAAIAATATAITERRFKTLVAGYEKRLKRADSRCDRAEARVDQIDAKMHAERDDCDRKLAAMRAELDAAIPVLMSEPTLPDYSTITRPTP